MKVTDEEKIILVVKSLREAGYNPHDQISGFLVTDDETYITRQGNAREMIKTINKDVLRKYIERQ